MQKLQKKMPVRNSADNKLDRVEIMAEILPPAAVPLVEIPAAQQHRIPEIQHQIQNHRKPGKRTKHLRILQKIQMRHLPLKRTIREK